MVGQGQFVEFGRDGFGGEDIDIAPQCKIDVRLRSLGSFRALSKELHRGDFRMTLEHSAHDVQLGRPEGWGVHPGTFCTNHSCIADSAGR